MMGLYYINEDTMATFAGIIWIGAFVILMVLIIYLRSKKHG